MSEVPLYEEACRPEAGPHTTSRLPGPHCPRTLHVGIWALKGTYRGKVMRLK